MPARFSVATLAAPRRVAAVSLAMSLSLIASTPVFAQWRVEPSVAAGFEYDDNATLAPDSQAETSLDGFAFEANAKIKYLSQRNEFSIDPKVSLKRYNDFSSFDVDDAFLDVDFKRTGQKSRFRIGGSFSEESTRTAERSQVDFDVIEPGEIPADDSGRITGFSQRQRIQLAPDWTYQIGLRTSINVDARYLDISYQDDVVDQFRDFSETQFGAGIDFDWTERDTIGIGGYSRDSDFDRDNRSISGYGVGLRYQRKVSERTRVAVDIGVDRTENTSGVDQSNSAGGISITRKLETGSLLATYQRRVDASGSGIVALRDLISISGTRNLSERFSIGLGIRGYQTDAIDGDVANFDERDYLQLRALFSWRATRDFTVEFDYRFTTLDRQSFASEADSNQFNLWFRYKPIL